MIAIKEKKNCCGCMACSNICLVNAIKFCEDNEGFKYPNADEDKCVNCGLCDKVCPMGKENNQQKTAPKVLAGWSNDDVIRRRSTSGALYYELAYEILKEGGYIAGAVYDENWRGIHHICTNDMKQLNNVMGSKYFQSDMRNVYSDTKTALETGKKVLFCGTPCQNVAFMRFLGKEYNNLIMCDFICRGINSPKAYNNFLDYVEEKYKSTVSEVHFKCKDKGWTRYGTEVKLKNGKRYFRENYKDFWSIGYVRENLYMRPSCHACQFKMIPRFSDITLADFWGIKDLDKEEYKKGVSLILVNSEKGQELIESLDKRITTLEQSSEIVMKNNGCVLDSTDVGKNREKFFSNMDKKRFDENIKSCMKDRWYVHLLKQNYRNLKRRIKGYRSL